MKEISMNHTRTGKMKIKGLCKTCVISESNENCDAVILAKHSIKRNILQIYECSRYKKKKYSWLFCMFMNIVDVRYWFCKCRYFKVHGKLIYAGCKRHD